MRLIGKILAAAAVSAAISLIAVTSYAEEPVWTKGKVKKVDSDQGKVTIRHEEIGHLEMPSMTMIFRVADPAMLEQLKPGQEGEFYFVRENGRMMIKQIKE